MEFQLFKVLSRYFLSFILSLIAAQSNAESPDSSSTILVLEIRAEIDPRMNRYVTLGLEKGEEINADYIVIDMDTYGGALNDADDIRTKLMDYNKPIYVYINKDAASAGALISIACDSIYMAQGASIGAATVVTSEGVAAPDKYQSYMRSIMRSTAEASGRDPKIAEAMVDQELEVDSISKKGDVITFSTSEAIKYGFCEGERASIEEILEKNNIKEYEIVTFKLASTEKIIAFFLNPAISGILILIIIGGIYFELQTPGVGFPIIASITAMILYFIPYYLNGLAENWEIIMFFVGVILIALEVFVIPGFGIAGIAGLTFSISALVLAMLNNDNLDFSFVDSNAIILAVATTLTGILGSIVIMFFGGARLANSQVFKKIALETVMDSKKGYTVNFNAESMLGKQGKAYTILRPGGKVIIDGEIYDAITRGPFIEKDQSIEVIEQVSNTLKVKEA